MAPRLTIFWHERYQMNTAPGGHPEIDGFSDVRPGTWGTGDGCFESVVEHLMAQSHCTASIAETWP